MPSARSAVKPSCCISQEKGVKIVVAVSCIFGLGIILLCGPILLTEATEQFPNSTAADSDDITATPKKFPNQSVYLGRKIAALGIAQIFSSLCLLNSKRFKSMATAWVIFQTLTVFIVLVFLWNLPLPPASFSSETRLQRFSRHLFNVLGINVCLTIFLILVLLEFMIHPEKEKSNELLVPITPGEERGGTAAATTSYSLANSEIC